MNQLSSYYVVGGTLRSDAECYVERPADHRLYDCLARGEFCYVLTSRQMGKSSLMVRTASRLRVAGHRVVTLDLTALGTNLTVDQWYGGLLRLMGEQLGLEVELEQYWLAHRHLGALQRWMSALREIALPARTDASGAPSPLIIFVDEIDAVRNLAFSTDEFFAAIRECYNARSAQNPLEALRFCLIGVAAPSDLIQDSRSTPFNIGQRIDLDDFTAREAVMLARGLENLTRKPTPLQRVFRPGNGAARARELLGRVMYWTAGHPYLTQRLCQALAESSARCARDVDRLCYELFLTNVARQRDDNLLFVRERLLRGENRGGVLALYERLLGPWPAPVADDEIDERVSQIRLAGVVRGEGGLLKLRNRIYARVFDRKWVVRHKPGQELRRQRAAFRRGMLRTGAVSSVIIGILAATAAVAYSNEQRAIRSEQRSIESENRLKTAMIEKGRTLALLHLERRHTRRAEAKERRQRLAAEGAAREALGHRRVAERQTRIALESRTILRRRLHRLTVEEGARLAAEGDPGGALLWFTEGLRLADPDAVSQKHQRMRIASALGQTPSLTAVWPRPQMLGGTLVAGNRFVLWGSDGLRLGDLGRGGPLRCLFRGRVVTGAPSADGRRLATVAPDSVVRTWDLSSEKELGAAIHPMEEVGVIALSPDGLRLAVGGQEGALRLYDLRTRGSIVVRDGGGFLGSAFSRDGGVLVTVSDRLRLRDPQTGMDIGPKFEHAGGWERLSQPALSPDGARVLARRDSALHVWDAHSGKWLRELPEYSETLRFTPDGRRMVLGTATAIRTWDVRTLQPVTLPIRVDRPLVACDLTAEGTRIQGVTAEGEQLVWDAATGEQLSSLRLGSAVQWALCSGDGTEVLTLSPGSVQVWNSRRLAAPWWSTPAEQSEKLPILDPLGTYAVTLARGKAEIRSVAKGASVQRLPHPTPVVSAAISPDGRQIVTAAADGLLRCFDGRTGRQDGTAVRADKKIRDVFISADGRSLLAHLEDFQGRVLDLRTRRWYRMPGFGGSTVTMSPNGRWVFAHSGSFAHPESALWRRRGRRFVRSQKIPLTRLTTSRFSPDSRYLAVISDAGTVKLWDVEAAGPVPGTGWHDGKTLTATFSPDGRTLVTAGFDRTARLWDVPSLRPLAAPIRHSGTVWHTAFSRDGSLLATTSDPGELRVYDARTGQPISGPTRLTVRGHAQFTAGGRSILVADAEGGVHEWSLPVETRSPEELRLLAEVLSQRSLRGSSIEFAGAARLISGFRRLGPQPHPRPGRPPEDLQWRAVQARAAERRREWALALAHLDVLVGGSPGEAAFRRRRAWALGELGRWREAARDYRAVLHAGGRDYLLYYHLAVTQLAAGDLAGYRATCANMLERFEASGTDREQEMTAWTCTLGPASVGDLRRPLRLIEQLLRQKPEDREYLETRVALLFRCGRAPDAIAAYHRSLELGPRAEKPPHHLLMALLYTRLGKEHEASRRCEAARAGAPDLTALPVREGAHAWDETAEYAALLREVESL